MKYILLRTDNTFEVVEIVYDKFLQAAYQYLDCTFIEIVNPGIGNLRLCIDDAGKLTGKDINILATIIYNVHYDKLVDPIVGNVLIGADEIVNEYGEHDFVGLPDDLILKLTDLFENISEDIKSNFDRNPA